MMESNDPDRTLSGCSHPLWAEQLQVLSGRLKNNDDELARDSLRQDTWLILHNALQIFLQTHSRHYPTITDDDRHDLATEKSLGLLFRIESGAWDLSDRHPLEIARYLSRVARNGMTNLCKKNDRMIRIMDEDTENSQAYYVNRAEQLISRETPEIHMGRKRYARALCSCFATLAPRLRKIWIFRVFGGLSSKMIAEHPEIKLKASHVDVLLHRSRQAISLCLRKRGFDSSDVQQGVFAEVLAVFLQDRDFAPKDNEDDEQ
ncbi:MAG: sigma-70 family RNA polymerase sigma factor [bacterium]|nr:sigma-70 family RNA polymerase sigma factor [bacterium]